MAHNIASGLYLEESFKGKLGEDINEYIGNYIDACSDYGLSPTQKLILFHNLF